MLLHRGIESVTVEKPLLSMRRADQFLAKLYLHSESKCAIIARAFEVVTRKEVRHGLRED